MNLSCNFISNKFCIYLFSRLKIFWLITMNGSLLDSIECVGSKNVCKKLKFMERLASTSAGQTK